MEAMGNVSHVLEIRREGCLKLDMERKFGARWEYLILKFIQVWSQRNFNAGT